MYFAGNTNLTSELRNISQLILEKLEYDAFANGNYAAPKYCVFEQGVVNSVTFGKFSGLSSVAAPSNSIDCNV